MEQDGKKKDVFLFLKQERILVLIRMLLQVFISHTPLLPVSI